MCTFCCLQDPEAYGAGAVPNPPMLKHCDSAYSLQSMNSGSYEGSECSDDSAQQSGGHMQRRRRGRAVLVAGLAVGALALSGVCGGGSSRSSSSDFKAGRRHGMRRSKVQQQRGAVVSHRLEEVPEVLEDC